MVFRLALLIQYLIVIVFLSSRERIFPIQIWQWCRNHICVFPLGLYPDGFPCFMSDFFGLQHHRNHDHDFTFSKLRKDLQTLIWDPGDSNHKTENGGIRPWTSHIYGSLFVIVSEIGILVLPRSTTSIILYIDVVILFHLLLISFGIREMLKFNTRDINLRFEDVLELPQSDQIVAPVHDHIDCDYFNFVMALWLHQFGFCWIEMSNLHVGLVKFWQQDLVGVAHIWRLKNALTTFRWESIDMRRSGIWDDMVNLFVVMLERITKSKYFKKTLVRKFWFHYVYISELALDTSALMLRFVKRSFSHKLLHTNRNKEKSNMKLDNNRFLIG